MRFACRSKRLPHHALYLGPLEPGVNLDSLTSTIWKEVPSANLIRPRTFGTNRFGMETYLEIELDSIYKRDMLITCKYFSFGLQTYPVVLFEMINKTTGLIIKHSNIQPLNPAYKIHIKGIQPWMKKDMLVQYFEEYGPVQKLILFKAKNFGFLTYLEKGSYCRLCKERVAYFLGVPLICSKSKQPRNYYDQIESLSKRKKLNRERNSTSLNSSHDGLADEAHRAKSLARRRVGITDQNHPSPKSEKKTQERVSGSSHSKSDQIGNSLHQNEIIDPFRELDSVGTDQISTVEVEQVTRTTLNIRQGGITYQRVFNSTDSKVFALY